MSTFEKMIEDGGFVEHAKFGGNRYGTSKKMIGELTAGGRVVVLDIEMEVCFLIFFTCFCPIACLLPFPGWISRPLHLSTPPSYFAVDLYRY